GRAAADWPSHRRRRPRPAARPCRRPGSDRGRRLDAHRRRPSPTPSRPSVGCPSRNLPMRSYGSSRNKNYGSCATSVQRFVIPQYNEESSISYKDIARSLRKSQNYELKIEDRRSKIALVAIIDAILYLQSSIFYLQLWCNIQFTTRFRSKFPW